MCCVDLCNEMSKSLCFFYSFTTKTVQQSMGGISVVTYDREGIVTVNGDIKAVYSEATIKRHMRYSESLAVSIETGE